jgi:hypothetical protein
MTIDRPMFPSRRDNPFHLVGGVDVTLEPEQRRAQAVREDDEPAPRGRLREQDRVARDIQEFERARTGYRQAVAWLAAAEAGEIPGAHVEVARQDLALLYEEMQDSARNLLVVMPTDLKGLVDLTMYLEKHFSILPEEINGRSLAFHLLKTVRLSLRSIAKYGNKRRED